MPARRPAKRAPAAPAKAPARARRAASATPPGGRPPRSGGPAGGAPRRRRRPFRALWRRFTFGGILIVVAMIGGVFHLINGVEVPEAATPAETSIVCLADVPAGECDINNSVAQFSSAENRVQVDYEDLPPVLIRAVIAAEDRHFFEHNGVDPVGIARALFRAATNTSESTQGASTITQQYVKVVYLTNEQSLSRKLNEAAIAIQLERQLSKEEILERYLNEVYLGRGAYGVEAAAQAYFDVTVADLTLPQAALLAGLLRAPERADPSRAPEEAKRRRRTVLAGMRAMGLITQQESDAANEEPFEGNVVPRTTKKNTRVDKDFGVAGGEYIAEWVRRQLSSPPFGANIGIDETSLYDAGLRIYLTIDPEKQKAASQAVNSQLVGEADPSAALVSVDERGRVAALIGGQNFGADQVNLALGPDYGARGRQPGSTFKPIALAAFIEANKSIQSVYEAPATKVFPKANDGQDWEVSNYDKEDLGWMTVERATWHSSNTVYAQLTQTIGPRAVTDMATKLGITSPLRAVASTALGTSEVSVMDMAVAYSTFANHGEKVQPYVISRVESASGRVLYEAPEAPRERVISPEVADTVTQVLRGVIDSGTGRTNAKLKQSAAGKTGTTDESRDAWFAGYTCHLTTVVWMGYPGEPSPMIDPTTGKGVTGGGLPAKIWRAYMDPAVANQEKCTYREIDAGTELVNPELKAGPPTTTVVPPVETPATPDPAQQGQPPSGDAPAGEAPTTTVPTANQVAAPG